YYFYLSSDHLKYNTRIIKNAIGDHPLMVTLRTKGEGGKAALGYAEYFNILEAIIEDGVIDIIDLQVKMPEAFLS
ncbi:MAG: type I 3-dehydroquinate dehydratase, partial [Erysipelotrichales bacterium]